MGYLRVVFENDIMADKVKVYLFYREGSRKYLLKVSDKSDFVYEELIGTPLKTADLNPTFILDEEYAVPFIRAFMDGARQYKGFEVESEAVLKGRLEEMEKRVSDLKETNKDLMNAFVEKILSKSKPSEQD